MSSRSNLNDAQLSFEVFYWFLNAVHDLHSDLFKDFGLKDILLVSEWEEVLRLRVDVEHVAEK